MGTVNINGKRFNIPMGSVSISVQNNQVKINGKIIKGDEKWESPLDIKVSEGVAINIICDGNVECKTVKGKVDAGGSVTIEGKVGGDVDCGGSVHVGDVGGNIDCGGSVNAGRVSGSIDAGGSVITR